MTTLIGNINEYDVSTESWSTYVERLEQYFLFNEVENERKLAALLTLMGARTFSLVKDLTTPEKPSQKTYDEVVRLLGDHFTPKPLKIAERFKFSKRVQKEGENVNEYAAALRHLTEHCEYGNFLDDALTQQFVCGVKDSATQKRLLTERELKFAKAVEIANSLQQAASEGNSLQMEKHVKAENDCFPLQSDNTRRRFPKSNRMTCYRCGKTGHNAEECFYAKVKCHNCGKIGHLQRTCTEKNERARYQDRRMKALDAEFDEQKVGTLTLNALNNVQNGPIWLDLQINGQSLKMELDTGSAMSVISYKQFRQVFGNCKLEATRIVLRTYTGEKVIPRGIIAVNVTYKNRNYLLDLYVLDTTGPPLIGRDWLKQIPFEPNIFSNSVATNEEASNETKFHLKSVESDIRNGSTPAVDRLVKQYSDVFNDELGCLKNIIGKLHLKRNTQPKFCKPRSIPFALKEKVDLELDNLQRQGIIEPVGWSEWATPIVPVLKKNGTVRICGDFKVTINPHLKVEQYPLPHVKDIFANLAGGQHFSKIDLRQAYLQMTLDQESQKLLVINTHRGLYQYKRLLFGVASAPALWQRAMEQVLQGLPFVQCLLDDMIVTGRTETEHLQNLERVLQRLQEYGLRVNKDKCEFFKAKIEFCGHEIDRQGLHKTQNKVDAVINCSVPKNVSELRSFLGLVNYYHNFLPHLASILHPLYELLKSDKDYIWSSDCDQAFRHVKRLMVSDQVLMHYDPRLPLKLACDASPHGIGAVLSHVTTHGAERPIAFISKSLSKAERNYSQIDKEALAIVWAVKKFHNYLFGRHFVIITDHQPLTSIFHPRKGIPVMTAARLQRYAIFLMSHDYSIEYRSTKEHGNADGLSRCPTETAHDSTETTWNDDTDLCYNHHFEQLPLGCDIVRKETKTDPILSRVLNNVLTDSWQKCPELSAYYNRRYELSVHQGCLVWGLRVIIPQKLRQEILNQLHEGHQGIVKMKALARSYVWWPKLDSDLEQLAKSCEKCLHKQPNPTPVLLHPWDWPNAPWKRIHIDFAGPFQQHMFLVVIDAHSKWPEVIPMQSITSSATIKALHKMFARYGLPEHVVTDNGPQLTSLEFEQFLKSNGIRHTTTSPWHPATNGLAERFVQTFKKALRSMQGEGTVDENLSNFLLLYRNTPHCLTSECPSLLFMKRRLRMQLDLLRPDLSKTIRSTQEKQVFAQNRKQPRQFDIGQSVAVRDYRNNNNRWTTGLIVSRLGNLNYEVRVSPNMVWRRHIDQIIDFPSNAETENLISPNVLCDHTDQPLLSDGLCQDAANSSAGEGHNEIVSANSSNVMPSQPDQTEQTADTTVPSSGEGNVSHVERRYPPRNHRPPERFPDFVY